MYICGVGMHVMCITITDRMILRIRRMLRRPPRLNTYINDIRIQSRTDPTKMNCRLCRAAPHFNAVRVAGNM